MKLNGKTIAILATDGYELEELHSPQTALEQEGAEVRIYAPKGSGFITAWQNGAWSSQRAPVAGPIVPGDAQTFDALILPGGVLNADKLRMDANAVRFVRNFFVTGRPLAVICHAPWLLIEALDLTGLRLTSYPSLRTDLINAGAYWEDEEVVVEGFLISSRKPDDLPAFNRTLRQMLQGGIRSRG